MLFCVFHFSRKHPAKEGISTEMTIFAFDMKKLLLFALALLCAWAAQAKVVLPQLFQSGMVLQRGCPIPVWGVADAGETVVVTFRKKTYTATADANGRWQVTLPKQKAGGPYELQVASRSQQGEAGEPIVLSNVLVGDVWLLSGQSNIDVTIERVYPWYTKDIDSYSNDRIRLFRVQNETNTHGPKTDIRPTGINWKPLSKQNAWLFSAVGYFLGREMFGKNGVPQGIIVNSWGGTPIEAWISADSLQRDYPMLIEKTRLYQDDDYVQAQARANQLANRRWNAMLNEKETFFTAPDYDDSDWTTIDQNTWGWRGIGTTWLRQHVHIDKAHARQPARLLLGTLFDQDFTYVNGHQVGHTGYQYPPRRYDIPEGLLHEGDNVIAVRFVNKYGTVHFVKEKPYLLAFGADRFSQNPMPADVIPLSTQWKHHVGVQMPACPSADVSLQNLPTTLYNAVLHPLAPYALSGVVWYQGESNAGNPAPYADLLRKMMGCWRDRWHNPQMPFVIVQLANYMEPSDKPQESGWAALREAQRLVAKEDPHAELACIIDLGEAVDIHPLRKREVAQRVAQCFDHMLWHPQTLLSPQVISSSVSGSEIILTLDQPIVTQNELHEFEVAASDGRYQPAAATARGNSIVIQSPLAAPRTVRYAWKNNPARANAYSRTGLPLTPFQLTLP